MTARLRLAVFDVDGTLVDSQAHIHAAMARAFGAAGLSVPRMAAVRGIIGLSLPEAVRRLAGGAPPPVRADIVAAYRDAFVDLRASLGTDAAPLYPGLADMLARLAGRDDLALGIATGKSRRGLRAVLEAHGLEDVFVTAQVADDHPSKPDPSMLRAALAETGVAPEDAVMIGDTVFDVRMARAASVAVLGVAWGYHKPARLTAAGARLVRDAASLETCLGGMLETAP